MELMIWNVVLTATVGIMGFVIKEKFNEVNRISILLNKTREEVARDYITKVEVRSDMQQIIDRFDKLEAKIDRVIEGQR
jgi:hypothetical protein